MADTGQDADSILDFVLIRSPEPVPPESLRRNYIHDGDFLHTPPGTHVPDPPTIEEYSPLGALVFKHVFPETPPADDDAMDALVAELLGQVGPTAPHPTGGTARKLRLEQLDQRAVIVRGGLYYVLPTRLTDVNAPYVPQVGAVVTALPAVSGLGLKRMAACYRTAFGADLSACVFSDDGTGHHADFEATVRGLFEALYLLYVLRRLTSIDLGEIIAGLRALHLLEALATDEVHSRCKGPGPTERDKRIIRLLALRYPALARWDGKAPVSGFPLVGTAQDAAAYLAARPVVHPLFARLFHYPHPFNDLKPLGVGDFKVVKQWLVEYTPGEICDIHNIMKGETKERVHRRLEKSEETYSFTGSFEEETSKDTQSTDRFELKREVENSLKTDLNVNANASVRYDNKVVLATVGAGFAYNRSDGTADKTAQGFSRELVSKAVSRVQTRTTEQRTSTRVFETEETNKHVLSASTEHVSGIYRWVDKRYRAQLFTYGKRMMFEFVLPEPAALFVAARLRAYEARLDLPRKPAEPAPVQVRMPVADPEEITPEKFDELRRTYDLSAFSHPPLTRTVTFVDTQSGASLQKEEGVDGSNKWYTKALKCSLPGATGYRLDRLFLTGQLQFDDHHQPPEEEADRNLVRIEIDGSSIWEAEDNRIYVPLGSRTEYAATSPYVFTRDDVDVVLVFQDIELYRMMISGQLSLTGTQALTDWRTKVYAAIHKVEKARADELDRTRRQQYDSALSAYTQRMSEIEAVVLNDLLQGTSEALNAELIRTEVRRQCLAMITKEYAADAADDLLTGWESMGVRSVQHDVTRLTPDPAAGFVWRTTQEETGYPVPKLDIARRKGSYIQFLEQAFDWDNLAHLCYPYFWATPPRWMELLARSDDTDPAMTAFLQAGAARVLVAVTPAYDDAVLHFLATREPWEGGPAPVIGDPLYLPLHDELRRRQDDRYGAEPEGEPWEFTIPTSLVYLHDSDTALPDLAAERKARQERDRDGS
ncbi:hypothetical protein STRCI_000183 [Streptomyces cinnabarinus]|uniref:Uncharacterized protein n=1 Tax=Streptomyces cinnabarinus TaxID=67287 RepID=A0ABY7K8T9_9ACTN|nr:hypothetical protein [Streptomyces cinnabarinus]WAZ19151.1 hypothetical protein STRCI_000183 [Streptomyces cinnabarinus]